MLEFVIIFSTVLAGFGRMNAGLVAVSALALMTTTYVRRRHTIAAADQAGLGFIVRHAVWRSSWHALVASALAFGGGIALRVIVEG